MHHLNCFVLESIVNALKIKIKKAVLLDCFSNSPDEIVFVFDSLSIKCIFFKNELFFRFEYNAPSKSRLFKPQFKVLHNLKILDLKMHQYERSFQINFENQFHLVFKCHGRKSNIILFDEALFSEHFRKQLQHDEDLLLENFNDRKIPTSIQLDLKSDIQDQFPFLPSEFISDLVKEKDVLDFNQLLNKYHSISAFDYESSSLSMKPKFDRETLLEDINQFTANYIRASGFIDLRIELMQKLQKQIEATKSFIASNQHAITVLENKRNEEEIGHIILSGMHSILPDTSKVILNDIYLNAPIEVRLDKRLNPVENAEMYFKKAKSRPYSIRILKEKINKAELKLQALTPRFSELENAKQWKDLKPFVKQNTHKKTNEDLPFRKFKVFEYDIYVGKSADSNEKILNYYSDKDDVWLHAKDVSGSHVLIKSQTSKSLPVTVLEKAAGLAAYYSKNRNQSLVTVAYTLRKYVRKIKGADKGKVSISKEQTILVKPGILKNE